MPLVIVTGYPCSGKTHRATQILCDFQSRVLSADSNSNLTVTYLPSHHASLDPSSSQTSAYIAPDQKLNPRDQIYSSSALEKTARAEEFSAVKRALSKNTIVIADGLNYIKGFRYQLWCEAKAVGTRCVVVHAAAREDEVSKWNDERLRQRGWEVELVNEAEKMQKITGPKIGRDIKGEMMPESHTALYGDKIIDYNGGTRSRSSSMGAGASDDEDNDGEDSSPQEKRQRLKDDTMTLKSLYISDLPDTTPSPTLQPVPSQTTTTSASPPPPPSSSLPYHRSTLASLLMRYEPPSPFTRWDTPLFTTPSADPHPDYQTIWTALFPLPTKALSKKALSQLPKSEPQPSSELPSEVRPHLATVLPKPTSSQALQTLESGTADVVKSLLLAAREQNISNGEGGTVRCNVPNNMRDGTTGETMINLEVSVPLNTTLTQPLLQRLRRKYTQIQRGGIAHGVGYVSGREEVVRGFVRFLEAEWEA